MSTKHGIKGYLRPGKSEEVEQWPWPDMVEQERRVRRNALGINPVSRPTAAPEPEPVADAPEPLTAEALDAIRQAAFEEGFEEGRQQGFEQGREEGRLQGMQEGHDAGLQQGLEQGLADGQARIREQTEQWQHLLGQLARPLAGVDRVVEQSLVTLAVELARNLLKTEAATSAQLLLATLHEAIEALPGHGGVTLYLNPEDLVLVEQHFDEPSRRQRGWELVAEPSFGRGDLRLKTAMSELDVGLARRIDELMANFIKANWERFHGTR